MDFHGQKVNLSFSIENILRDDFPHPRKTNVIVNVPTRTASTFDGWPKMPVYHCGYEVRFSPLLMEYPPNAPSCSSGRVGGKIHRHYGDEKRFTEDSHDRFDQTKKLAGTWTVVFLFIYFLFYSRTDFSKVLIWWTAYRSNLKMIAKRYKIFSNLILDLSWKLLSLFFLEWKEHDYFESDNFVGNRILGIILYIVQLVNVCLVTHIGNCKQGLTNKLDLL